METGRKRYNHTMSGIREFAVKSLLDIEKRNKKPKAVLVSLSDGLEKRDRAFLMELVYGVLRYKITLDWIFKKFLKKPSGLEEKTINILRLGLYEIFFMRTPEWASVNEAVSLEKKHPALVNGVLRNALRNKTEIETELNRMRESAELQNLSAVTSHPLWLIKRWAKRFGLMEALELADSNNKIPPLTLRVNTLKTTRDDVLLRLKEKGIEAVATNYSPSGIKLVDIGDYTKLTELYGLITAQDEAAQLVSYLLDPKPGDRVLDACAAPGGKTTHIAQLMEDKGEIVAVDIDDKRVSTLKENVETLGITTIKAIKSDIFDLKRDFVPFDKILLDAPCSSIGVIKRNPDVKYRHKPADLLRFGEIQLDMLVHVSGLLRPGGTLVYSTCSTEPEEGEEVIYKFLKGSPDFHITKKAGIFYNLFENGFIRTYPHKHDMDGFFMAKMVKNR